MTAPWSAQPYTDVDLPLTVGWGAPADAVLPLTVGWDLPIGQSPNKVGSGALLVVTSLSATGSFAGSFTVSPLAVTAGLQALGSVMLSRSSSALSVTSGLSAAGSNSSVLSGSSSVLAVTAGLSASGTAGATSNLFGGDSALPFTFPFTFGLTQVTVVLSAAGAITAGGPLSVTVTSSSAGVLGRVSGGVLTVTAGLGAPSGAYGFTGGPTGVVSAGLSADGSITAGAAGAANATVTVGLSAVGALSVSGAKPVIIANPMVGPQALRNLFRRKPQAQNRIVGFVGGDSSPFPFTFPLTFRGTQVVAGLSASGSLDTGQGRVEPVVIANPFVGPQALRNALKRRYI